MDKRLIDSKLNNLPSLLEKINYPFNREKGKHGENLLFFRILDSNDDIFYFSKDKNNVIKVFNMVDSNNNSNNDTNEIKAIENTFKTSCYGHCNSRKSKSDYNIDKEFIIECYNLSNISVLSVSKNINKRSKVITYTIFGLLLLKMNLNYLKINLICSNKRIGSNLLTLTEDLGKLLKVKKIKLDSLTTPFSFYIHKGYKPIPGKFYIPFNSGIMPRLTNKTGKINPMLKKYGRVSNKHGITHSLSNLNLKSYRVKSGKFGILGTPGQNDIGVAMEKILIQPTKTRRSKRLTTKIYE